MKLSSLIRELNGVLNEYSRGGRVVRIDPETIDHILWFLNVLQRREGHDVERPEQRSNSGRSYEKNYENPGDWEFGASSRKKRSDEWDEVFRNSGFDFSGFAERVRQAQEQAYRAYQQSDQKPPPRSSKASRPWYEVLGVRQSSTQQERLRAYRSLAMQRHPDRPGGSTEAMQELNEAKREAGL